MKVITFTQFMHPNGRKVSVQLEVPDEIAMMAEKQIITCECMPNNYGEVVLYSRLETDDEEDEEIMIADNGPGERSPTNTLIKLIRLVNQRGVRNGQGIMESL